MGRIQLALSFLMYICSLFLICRIRKSTPMPVVVCSGILSTGASDYGSPFAILLGVGVSYVFLLSFD